MVHSQQFQGQAPQPLAVQGEHRIGHSRRDGRGAWFAHAFGVCVTWHRVGDDLGSLVDAQHFVIMEIALLHPALLEADVAKQRGGQAIHHGAFHLLGHAIGVDHGATVHGAHHAVHPNLLVFHRHLGHLGHDGAKGFVQGHAQCSPAAVRVGG